MVQYHHCGEILSGPHKFKGLFEDMVLRLGLELGVMFGLGLVLIVKVWLRGWGNECSHNYRETCVIVCVCVCVCVMKERERDRDRERERERDSGGAR